MNMTYLMFFLFQNMIFSNNKILILRVMVKIFKVLYHRLSTFFIISLFFA